MESFQLTGRGLGGCRFPAKLCRKSNLGLLRKSSEGGEAKRCQASSFRAPGICILASAIIDVWHAPALKQRCKSLHEAVQRAGLRPASLAGPSLQFGDDLPPLPNATPACSPCCSVHAGADAQQLHQSPRKENLRSKRKEIATAVMGQATTCDNCPETARRRRRVAAKFRKPRQS